MPRIDESFLRQTNKFSKLRALVFLLAFGAIGSLIYLSFAAPNPNLQGDLNNDNVVDVSDLSILASNYKTNSASADINSDGIVSIADLSILLSHYGQTYSGGGGAPTYAQQIAYSNPANRPAFTCLRTVNVTNASQLTNAINNLQAGDCVNNTQSGGFTVSGEFQITKQLSSYAVVDLKTGSDAVRFVGDGNVDSTAGLPSVWVVGSNNLRIYGGDISNQAVYMYQNTNITWWNFYAHDLGGDGFDLIAPNGPLTNADIQGEVYNWGVNCLVGDPHAEKCTGIHAMNIGDAGGEVSNSRIALYAHDGRSGAGIELGSPSVATSGLTIYLKANNLTMAAQSQVAGNGIQIWGGGPLINITIPYIEVSNAQGRAIDTNGLGEYGNNATGVTVNYGRATNVLLNPLLTRVIWDTRGGINYQDVSPLP